MKLLPLFKSCLISALDRQYLSNKWIGDQSLSAILQKNYSLEFANKNYINRILPNIFLSVYKCHHVRINGIKNNEKKAVNATFYYLTTSSIAPKSLSTKLQWQEVYNNFKVLRSNQQNI